MPPLFERLASNLLWSRANAAADSASSADTTLQVICAWPISGQYGPGSRVLYYVLVAACIFAHKVEWLRNACLAAALIFPVVAAVHGIVLAAVHIDAAVDMDVYGAFQLCAIGVLAAPVTVWLSRTYFEDPGRNTIFVWSTIVLAGLLSLTIEFYRISPVACSHDDMGGPISSDPTKFPYGNANCSLVCTTEAGPFSPIRGGSANNIYIIPSPTKLTFNAATLLAAACCIPAILLLASMWFKILKDNWKRQSGAQEAFKNNRFIKHFRRYATVLIFGPAVFAILVLGEINLFSSQVRYQTEPIANIGQWAPIAGTSLAVLGSLYLLIADAMAQERHALQQNHSDSREKISYPGSDYKAVRNLVRMFLKISDYISKPATGRLEHEGEFRGGRAGQEYPTTPGEELQNDDLSRTRSRYGEQQRDSDSDRSGIGRHRSDAVSSGDGEALATRHETAARQPYTRTRRQQDTAGTPEVPPPVFLGTSEQRSMASSSTSPPIIRIETPE